MVTTAEQELTERGEKRYALTGTWQIEYRTTYPNQSGEARKRVGMVPCDSSTPDRPETCAAAKDTPREQVAERFPEGTEALSYLPRAVRASLIGHVPNPTMFDGTLLRFSDPETGTVLHHEVNMLRMNSTHAVVVRATRQPNGNEWEVSQATYTLGTPEVEQV